MDIDWSKAPEGAEFWNPHNELFYRSADGEFQKFSETLGRWTLASGERHEYQTLIARPATAPWKGEGPPRTPEQIAEEERESGIEGILKAVSSSPNCKAHGLEWDVAGAIYDAGYRKFEIVEGE